MKFMAWHKERKRFFDVLSIGLSTLNGRKERYELNDGYVTIWSNLDEVELMWFTGVKDVKDNGLYTGHIVKAWKHLFLIYWDDKKLQYQAMPSYFGMMSRPLIELFVHTFKIVGDKFQGVDNFKEELKKWHPERFREFYPNN